MDVCDEEIRGDTEYFSKYLFSQLETEIENRNLSELNVDEVQLVLEPKLDERGLVTCCYYFVNPQTRKLFWLNEWKGDSIFKGSKGLLSLPHKGKLPAAGHGGDSPGDLNPLGLGIQAEYWCAVYVSHALQDIYEPDALLSSWSYTMLC